MSLINQMLKDIDKRQGATTTTFQDASGVKLEMPRARSGTANRGWVLGGAILVVVAGGVYWFRQPATPAVEVKVAAVAPAVPATSVPVPTVVAASPASVPVAAAPAVPVPAPKLPEAPAVRDKPQEVIKASHTEKSQDAKPTKEVVVAASSATDTASKSSARKDIPAPAVGQVTRMISAEQRAEDAYRDAVTMARQGRMGEAQQLLKQALGEHPALHDARLLYARILMDGGKLSDAKAVLSDGLNLKPPAFQLYSTLAHAQLISKEPDAAVETLERGLSLAGENAEYQAMLAAALQQQGRHADAVQHYVVALRQFPDAANWLVGLGVSLQAQNNNSGAAEAYQRALELGLPTSLAQYAREKLNQLGR